MIQIRFRSDLLCHWSLQLKIDNLLLKRQHSAEKEVKDGLNRPGYSTQIPFKVPKVVDFAFYCKYNRSAGVYTFGAKTISLPPSSDIPDWVDKRRGDLLAGKSHFTVAIRNVLTFLKLYKPLAIMSEIWPYLSSRHATAACQASFAGIQVELCYGMSWIVKVYQQWRKSQINHPVSLFSFIHGTCNITSFTVFVNEGFWKGLTHWPALQVSWQVRQCPQEIWHNRLHLCAGVMERLQQATTILQTRDVTEPSPSPS